MRSSRSPIFIACVALFMSAPALAQTPAQPGTAAEAAPGTAAEAAPGTAATGTAPEATPAEGMDPARQAAHARMALQEQCESAIIADAEWHARLKGQLAKRLLEEEPTTQPDKVLRAELRDMLRPEVHTEDTNRLLRNKQHVVYAYGALWILTALFVLFMFVRQRSLSDEIARLRRELEKAIE